MLAGATHRYPRDPSPRVKIGCARMSAVCMCGESVRACLCSSGWNWLRSPI